MRSSKLFARLFVVLVAAACGGREEAAPPAPAPESIAALEPAPAPVPAPTPEGPEALITRAMAFFPPPPEVAENPDNVLSDAKIVLGRQLYFDERLSKNQDIACNSCHVLSDYGVDTRTPGGKTSIGHKGQRGGRNSPTVYNAALHFSQFWDGRAKDVEEQAKGPILNPVEMAMPNEAAVVKVLESIPGYAPMFQAAFPDSKEITYEDMAKAIGAFERRLVTRAPLDEFLAGKADALDAKAQAGLALFLDAGCAACHTGPAVGGQTFQKLGLIKPYPTEDEGRAEVTKNEAEKFFFKVPGLRNVARTAPYFHDGSVATLEHAVAIMAEHQTAKGTLSAEETAELVAFLSSLTGALPTEYIAEPEVLAAGTKTPKPDPN